MTNDPAQIRADIERTRAELGSDVDALADKVTPSKIVERQTDKVKSAFGGVKDRVMGAASDARDTASAKAGSVNDASHHAVDSAKGNPMAVGLIAFGVGLLVASLIPASSKEKELATDIKEAAQPLVEEATDAAKTVVGNLKEPAKAAADAVKQTATESASTVKEEASSAAGDLRDDTQSAKDAVQNQQR